jgi:hypothetical protein
MKIIALEEHYGLPAIYEAAKKANDPYELVFETLKEAGHSGSPEGIYDLGEGRIAAMDEAGIDVAVLSYAPPSPVPRICHATDARPRGCSPRTRAHRARPALRGRTDKWPGQRALP